MIPTLLTLALLVLAVVLVLLLRLGCELREEEMGQEDSEQH